MCTCRGDLSASFNIIFIIKSSPQGIAFIRSRHVTVHFLSALLTPHLVLQSECQPLRSTQCPPLLGVDWSQHCPKPTDSPSFASGDKLLALKAGNPQANPSLKHYRTNGTYLFLKRRGS